MLMRRKVNNSEIKDSAIDPTPTVGRLATKLSNCKTYHI